MEGSTMKYSSIGWAVGLLLHGHIMRRKAWVNIEWVRYIPGGAVLVPHKFGEGNRTGPFLVAKTKEGMLVPWLSSQTDLLADDWEMVNALAPGEYHATPEQMQSQP